MIYIIAGNFAQARLWANEQALSLAQFRYVSTEHTLRGVRAKGSSFVAVGTWYEHKDINRIHEMLHWVLEKG